eukprot:TRINITY_DN49641_c0_g1_i1.p1 TRINITY_DN49641_c0_g1~~TRINITY_DN49641_c0_g1_i1.p1  ORF type:complete len:502 (+),score=89.04 TRINITY_DN49641_c0_g1_i1:47-1552(+)
MPVCTCCGEDHPRTDYSANQLRKKAGRKCNDCIADAVPSRPQAAAGYPGTEARTVARKTPAIVDNEHCTMRLGERGVSPSEVALALQYGDRAVHREQDGTVRYTYKGVVYIVNEKDQEGLTAWRLEPMQCTCKINPDSLRAGDPLPQRGMSRKQQIFAELQIKQMRAVCNHARVGSGSPCACCMASVEPMVEFLSHVDWAKPCYREVMSDVQIMGLCLLAACGGRLVPQYCSHCHGVRRLRKLPTHGFDEGPVVQWVRRLLENAAEKNSGREECCPRGCGICGRCGKIGECSGQSCNPIVNFSGHSFMVALGAQPIELAVRAGFFRIAVELLSFGADRTVLAWRRELGVSALEELVKKACMEQLRDLRLECGAAFYEDILELVVRGFRPPTNSDIEFRSKLAGMLGSFNGAFADMQVVPAEGDGGFLWDGRGWRFFLTGTCECNEIRCHKSGFAFVSSVSLHSKGGQVDMPEPLGSKEIAPYLASLDDGNGKKYTIAWPPR